MKFVHVNPKCPKCTYVCLVAVFSSLLESLTVLSDDRVRLTSNPFEQLGPDSEKRSLLLRDFFYRVPLGTLQGLIAKCFPKKLEEDANAERLFYERLGVENPRAGDKRARSEDAQPLPSAAASSAPAAASAQTRPVSPGPERAAKKAARSDSMGSSGGRRSAPPAPAAVTAASPKPIKSSLKKTPPASPAQVTRQMRGVLF